MVQGDQLVQMEVQPEEMEYLVEMAILVVMAVEQMERLVAQVYLLLPELLLVVSFYLVEVEEMEQMVLVEQVVVEVEVEPDKLVLSVLMALVTVVEEEVVVDKAVLVEQVAPVAELLLRYILSTMVQMEYLTMMSFLLEQQEIS